MAFSDLDILGKIDPSLLLGIRPVQRNPNAFDDPNVYASAIQDAYKSSEDIADSQSNLANEFSRRLQELDTRYNAPQTKTQKWANIASTVLPAIGAVIDGTSGNRMKRAEAMDKYRQTMATVQAIRDKAEKAKSTKKEDELKSLQSMYELGLEPIRAEAKKQEAKIEAANVALRNARENRDFGLRKKATEADIGRGDAAEARARREEANVKRMSLLISKKYGLSADESELYARSGSLPPETASPEQSLTEYLSAKREAVGKKYELLYGKDDTLTAEQKEAAYRRLEAEYDAQFAIPDEPSVDNEQFPLSPPPYQGSGIGELKRDEYAPPVEPSMLDVLFGGAKKFSGYDATKRAFGNLVR